MRGRQEACAGNECLNSGGGESEESGSAWGREGGRRRRARGGEGESAGRERATEGKRREARGEWREERLVGGVWVCLDTVGRVDSSGGKVGSHRA